MAASKASLRPISVPRPTPVPLTASTAPPHPAVLVAVALVSALGLVWEITLTRLASVVLSYHFAFVAVSLAIFGLGLGAALVYALPERRARGLAVPAAACAALAFPLVALLTPAVAATGSIGGLVALALLPFLVLGVVMAAVFRAYAAVATLVYGADLAGAGLGAAAVVLSLNLAGPFGTLFVLGALAALATVLFTLGGPGRLSPGAILPLHSTPRGVTVAALALLVLNLAGLGVQVTRAPLGIDYATLRNAPPDKTIVNILRDPSQHARVLDSRWDAYARTDVVATADPTQRDVFTDGGGGTYMLRWNGNPATQRAHLADLETVPFLLGPHANVLVIGAGGGIDVVRALVAGARHVTAVELNAATVAAVRAERAYNGGVLDRPNVTTVVDDGRHFLARTKQHYDVILLNLVYSGAAEGTSHALDESYIFTTEAFQSYIAHLTPNGRIGVIAHQALEGTRAFLTALQAEHQRGLSYGEALLRSTLLMTNNDTPESRPTLAVVSNSPFARSALDLLRARGNGDLNLQPLYVPYYYGGAFKEMQTDNQSLADFMQGSDYAVGPTDDDRPFFFDLNLGWPDGLSAALWYAALVVAGVFALVFFLREGPDEEANRRAGATARLPGGIWSLGLYMALLGIGFMCVEVPVIQRFILVLGEPVLALTVVLTTLLIAGGAGSLLGARLFSRPTATPLAPVAVALLILAGVAVFPLIGGALLGLGQGGTIATSVLLLIPLGLALGLPFPLGLRLAARVLPGDVALFWSINALCSVLGSVLAAVIAVQIGFGAVLGAGALCYLLAAAVLRFMVTKTVPVP